MNELAAAFRALLEGVAGVALAALPRRHWGRFDLPVPANSWISAIVTIALGFFLGVHGYLQFAQALGEAAASQAIELSHQIVEGRAPASNPGAPFVSSMLALFAFLLTPSGLVAAYLAGSGLVRALGSAAGQPSGDPVLTLADAWYERHRSRTEAERASAARIASEGPEVPDELVPGPGAGFPDADWVVIASRLKTGWDRGAFVVTPGRWYRLADAFDRRTPEGLRRVYVLHAVGQAEVIRRSVFYDHPRLSGLQDSKGDTPRSASEMA